MSWPRKGLYALKLAGMALVLILIAQMIWRFDLLAKTVQWEEEVPLNTGETIWVKRTVEYTLQGGGGNPLDVAYRPNMPEKLQFIWQGKQYMYDGDARVILLAISPQNVPVLVARAADNAWNWKHSYFCVAPFYVQFVSDATGRVWTWPPAIEPWLLGISYNLMRTRSSLKLVRGRYSSIDREGEDRAGSVQSPSQARIDPAHTTNDCTKRR